jgi:hypothetical protein
MIKNVEDRIYSIAASVARIVFGVIGFILFVFLSLLSWMLSINAAGGGTFLADVLFWLELAGFTIATFYLAFRLPQFKSVYGWTIFFASYIGILLANLLTFFDPGY